ncbi:SWIM zinc finger family protein [Allostreptomyces psammosilenae]|uniref:SWIM-type domain-containing protein n=1 Tax=Allostreptomyces psammosilenae TaxID=1892865 RepID=A0A853A2Y0_9ACTN|nr:SWIM zinc finger family protein [Allostreptomyces psammosilenae]NYI05091.1 hypothetical protein [Allostreptomyces psammosilenae]
MAHTERVSEPLPGATGPAAGHPSNPSTTCDDPEPPTSTTRFDAHADARGLTALLDVHDADHRTGRAAPMPLLGTAWAGRLHLEAVSRCRGVYALLDLPGVAATGVGTADATATDAVGTDTATDATATAPAGLALLPGGRLLAWARSATAAARPTATLHTDRLTLAATPGGELGLEPTAPHPRHPEVLAAAYALTSGFRPRAVLAAPVALRLLHELATLPPDAALWVVPEAAGPRLSTRAEPGAVCLPGPGRLAPLRRLLPSLRELRLFGPAVGHGAEPAPSAWQVTGETGGARLTLLLSPEPARGLPGEGAVLEAPWGTEAGDDHLGDDHAILAAAGTLGWTFAPPTGTTPAGAAPVGEPFHRLLPLPAGRAAALPPRLSGALALAARGAVRLEPRGGHEAVLRASVEGRNGPVRVTVAPGRATCTCPWWAYFRGGRGPCKHVLATRITAGRAAGGRLRPPHPHPPATDPAATGPNDPNGR